MLAEGIKKIRDMADEAARPHILEIEGDPRRVLIANQGKLTWHELPPPTIQAEVDTLDDLYNAVAYFRGAQAASLPTSSFWVAPGRIIGFPNDDDPRDYVTLKLIRSEAFKMLSEFLPRQFSQAELVKFLKFELAGCVDAAVIDIFRRLNFRHRNDSSSNVGASDESLGRSVENAVVSDVAEIPDRVYVTTPVYTNKGLHGPLTLGLTVWTDSKNESFRVAPMPDTLTRAKAEVLELAAAELRERTKDVETAAVFLGTPRN